MYRLIGFLVGMLATHAWATCPAVPTDCPYTPINKTVTGWAGILGGPWTTGTRPPTPQPGIMGYNSSILGYEFWNGSAFMPFAGGTGGSGTVTSLSVATANGFSGTVANPTTTPTITISTTVNGIVKGNGTGLSAATPGTDYLAPTGSGALLTGLTWSQLGSTPTTFGGYGITGGTLTAEIVTAASTTGSAGLNLPPGTAPTSPVNGDLWLTSAGLFARVAGVTVGPFGTGGGTGCTVGAGVAGLLVTANGSSGCALDGAASVTAGALSLGSTGVPGSVVMGNATSGVLTLQPVTGALGAVTVSIPAATDTLVNLAGVATLTNKTISGAANTLTNIPIAGLTGLGTGVASALAAATNGTGGFLTFSTIGTSGATLGLLNGNNTYSGNDIFSGLLTFSGLSAGTQVSCLGLSSGNVVVLSAAACGAGGGGGTPANPTATAGPAAVNGTATTYMRSDAAPAVQKAGASQFGIVQPGTTLACPSGVCDITITDTVHTTSATTANLGGQDDYSSASAITATLATLGTGQTATITDQNTGAMTVNLNSQTVVGLPSPTTLHNGGFYGFVFNSLGTLSGFGFPGFGTITPGALMKYADATGAATVATAADIPATPLATGTSVSLVGPRQYYVCTGTCTVTPPVPVAGYEFCVMNDDNVSTVITLAALGSSARYENTARTAYGTAGTGTYVSGGAVGDKICIVGRDATHYLTASFNGTGTVN